MARRPGHLSPTALTVIASLTLLALALVLWQRSQPARLHYTSGTASVTGTQASIETAGWTYGLSGSVPLWTDSAGSQRGSTWPDCLADLDGSAGEVRFGWVLVSDESGARTRVVVDVDCAGTAGQS